MTIGRPRKDRELVIKHLNNLQLTIDEIAEKSNCSRRTVYIVASEIGMDMPLRGEIYRLIKKRKELRQQQMFISIQIKALFDKLLEKQ